MDMKLRPTHSIKMTWLFLILRYSILNVIEVELSAYSGSEKENFRLQKKF